MRVLVVEDEFLQRREIAVALAAAGYETDEAANGLDALERMRRHLPDLVLLDMRMPRMNGLDFRREQLKDPTLTAVPFVLLSATPGDANISALRPVAVVTKPIDLAALLKLINGLRNAN